MTLPIETQRQLVKQWADTGRWLEDERALRLRELSEEQALDSTRELLALAWLVPIPPERWATSGLIEQQAWFSRGRQI